MDDVIVEVLGVFEHFIGSLDGSVNGIYKIELNRNTAIIYRNGKSWGVLSHSLNEPVAKCMGYLREDRIEVIEKAINEYLLEHDEIIKREQ